MSNLTILDKPRFFSDEKATAEMANVFIGWATASFGVRPKILAIVKPRQIDWKSRGFPVCEEKNQ